MSLPEVKGRYFLSERFSQDPIENYFRQQRSHGGRCDNPTVDALFTSSTVTACTKAAKLCFQCEEILVVRGD